MKELSNLLGFRESIKVVDATLRDGGLVNDFYFTDDFVKALYQANIDAGVDYMEMGYRASKKIFDESKFGKWKFCSDDHIREIVGENDTDLKLAIMADIGRHDKNDFDEKVNSPVDLVRVAAYIHQMPEAIDMVEDAAKNTRQAVISWLSRIHRRKTSRLHLICLARHQWMLSTS